MAFLSEDAGVHGDASANKMDNDGSIHLHTGSIGHCRHVLIMVCKSTGTVQQLESYSGKAFELSFFLLNASAIPKSLQTHHHLLLLVVQKSGIHQFRMVAYPTIYDGFDRSHLVQAFSHSD